MKEIVTQVAREVARSAEREVFAYNQDPHLLLLVGACNKMRIQKKHTKVGAYMGDKRRESEGKVPLT